MTLKSKLDIEAKASATQSSIGFWKTDQNGDSPRLPRGKARVALKVDSEDAGIAFNDSKGKGQALIGVMQESPALVLVKDADPPYVQEKAVCWIGGYQVGGKSLIWGRG